MVNMHAWGACDSGLESQCPDQMKLNGFCGLCLPADAGTSRFPPLPRLRRGKQASKNSFPQTPFLFAHLLETPAIFSDGGGTKR